MFDNDLVTLTLAQGSPPPPGSGVVPPPPGGGDAGTSAVPGGQAAGGSGGGPFGGMFMPLLLVLLVMMITFTMLGQRRDKKKKAALLNAIKKHDRVQTVGGVIGSVVEIKPDTVLLKVDETSNTRITFARSAVQQVLDAGPDEVKALDG